MGPPAATGVVMDILLAHGYFLAEDAAEQRIMRPHPPLGLLYLSSHLKARGLDVGVFDSTFQRLADFERCLHEARPQVVGIAVNLMTKRNALRMIALARAAGARVVLGGPDPPHNADEYLAAGADVVVIGEGEQTLEELLPILREFADLIDARRIRPRVRALSFAAGDHRARSQLPRSRRAAVSRSAGDRSAPLSGRVAAPSRVRARFADHRSRLPLHMHLVQPLGVRHDASPPLAGQRRRRSRARSSIATRRIDLWYADDVFAIHRSGRSTYAAELQRRQLRLPFECISRAERIDDAVADALASSGCWRVWIGSESGSQRMLDAMQRRVTVERVA